jgi:hypothetical protein
MVHNGWCVLFLGQLPSVTYHSNDDSTCSWSGFRGLRFDSGPNQDKYAGLGWSDFAWVAGSLGCTSERVGLDGLTV